MQPVVLTAMNCTGSSPVKNRCAFPSVPAGIFLGERPMREAFGQPIAKGKPENVGVSAPTFRAKNSRMAQRRPVARATVDFFE
jgi:hypothetical protein